MLRSVDAFSPRDRAVAEQLAASDPGVSAFVEASAGSGKTKLLTDRMLRLMLGSARPGRIQCLTFTKAAAAEMAVRLQRRLGRWATLDDAPLDHELTELHIAPSLDNRVKARKLFADVLDLPGGMRIGTIHAFCQSLLRRFPLEAAISPHFRLVEDADARIAMEQAREAVLAAADPRALQGLAGLATADRFGHLLQVLDAARDRLGPLLRFPEPGIGAAVRRAAGVQAGSEAALIRAAVTWDADQDVAAVLRTAQAHGSEGVRTTAERLLGWLGLPPELRAEHWEEWLRDLLRGDGAPRAPSAFAAKRLAEQHPGIHATMQAEQARVVAVEAARRTLRMAAATTALLELAAPALRAYDARKQLGGLLDYGDLITRTGALLRDPGAEWVLYKLDGGIDHLLLDEVQDTAPEQWKIAHRLTEEFFAGLGARQPDGTPARTFFAVGDPKQSIYSFQGADPEEFSRSRDQMAARVGGSGKVWKDVTLDVSFRSAAPVLALVDAVFADPVTRNGVADRAPLHHYAERAGAAGRVELWPLAPVPEAPEAEPWTVPKKNLGLVSAPQRLADALATWIAAQTDGSVMLESRGRALGAGDILVLVRRRTDFARNLVRALKTHGVAVAGLDRLELTAQAAVQDVLSACDAVLLPHDDLALACMLTSPLGGLDDDGLMRLALGRPGRLWQALRDRAAEDPAWQSAWTFLSRLQTLADYVTPHALLAEALGPLGGRARLLARLGPEAAEPLDELLGAALSYTALHPPSLQGFVHWLRRSGATVKREAGGSGGAVRVMTVHGAKGLQAPLVILPDTTGLPPEDEPFAWQTDPATGAPIPLWAPRREFRCPPVDAARADEAERRTREYNRLLYVALTRAEDRLVVCGWETRRPVPDTSWYAAIRRAFMALDASAEPFEAWEGERLSVSAAQTRPVSALGQAAAQQAAGLPSWAGHPGDWRPAPLPAEPALPVPIAPSRPDGIAFGPVPRRASPLTGAPRFLRGTLVHELLQYLPGLPEQSWHQAATTHLARHGMADAVPEVLAVLHHPSLGPLFGPLGRAEQPLTGLVGGTVVTGTVDRLAVLTDRVLLADYKTGRAAPADVAGTPVTYLRQLAAYRAVLRGIYPDKPVQCALVWTEGATAVTIPPDLLDAHAPRA